MQDILELLGTLPIHLLYARDAADWHHSRSEQEHSSRSGSVPPRYPGTTEPARSTAASGHVQRPPRTYRTGAVTRWIRIATVGFTAIVIAVALIRYPALPDSVPTHFGITGEPDAWGPPSSMFPLLAILAALVGGMTWLSFHPRYFNFPVEITDDLPPHNVRPAR